MKTSSFLLGLILVAAVGCAEQTAPDQDKSEWMTDLPAAEAKAREENKLVLVEFTGSDWCPPCIQLKKNVLSATEFKEFAADNLVLVELDFPHRKKQSAELKRANEALAEKFEVSGFPTVIVLDGAGKQLLRIGGYDGSNATEFVAKLKRLKEG